MNTDEHGSLAALIGPAENPESRVERRMDVPIHRLDTPQRTLQRAPDLPLSLLGFHELCGFSVSASVARAGKSGESAEKMLPFGSRAADLVYFFFDCDDVCLARWRP
jgi:hypothetical protein